MNIGLHIYLPQLHHCTYICGLSLLALVWFGGMSVGILREGEGEGEGESCVRQSCSVW